MPAASCRPMESQSSGPQSELWSSVGDLLFLAPEARPETSSIGAMPGTGPGGRSRRKCVYKDLELAGSLMESVVAQGTVTSIPDVRQHVSEQAAGLIELLFAVDMQVRRRRPFLALRMFPAMSGACCHCPYLTTHTDIYSFQLHCNAACAR